MGSFRRVHKRRRSHYHRLLFIRLNRWHILPPEKFTLADEFPLNCIIIQDILHSRKMWVYFIYPLSLHALIHSFLPPFSIQWWLFSFSLSCCWLGRLSLWSALSYRKDESTSKRKEGVSWRKQKRIIIGSTSVCIEFFMSRNQIVDVIPLPG